MVHSSYVLKYPTKKEPDDSKLSIWAKEKQSKVISQQREEFS